MCFSAPASFIASGGLAAIGGASLVIAKKEDKILAAVPLLFAIQQAFEGVQWLHLNAGAPYLPAAYGFLFFAFIVWPVYVPVFVYILDKERRNILKWFIFLGVLIALYFACLFLTQTVSVSELRACISYNFYMPFNTFATIPYIAAVLGPLFISSKKVFKFFGIIAAVSSIISLLFFTVAFVSVWCFFAAVMSSLFFFYILQNKKQRGV